jgi:hypothetical protein
MENTKHWSDLPLYSRASVEAKYFALTDKQWAIVVEEIDNEIDNDDSDEPLFLDEQINHFVSNITEIEAEHDLWNAKLASNAN